MNIPMKWLSGSSLLWCRSFDPLVVVGTDGALQATRNLWPVETSTSMLIHRWFSHSKNTMGNPQSYSYHLGMVCSSHKNGDDLGIICGFTTFWIPPKSDFPCFSPRHNVFFFLHQPDTGWNPIINGMFTTVFNWCRISPSTGLLSMLYHRLDHMYIIDH